MPFKISEDKSKMKIVTTKAKKTQKISIITSILTSFLVFAMAFTTILPMVNAHSPPMEIQTYAYITVSPNPVGVDQTVRILMWLDQTFPDANAHTNEYRFHNYKLTITKPNDTTETKTWDVCMDTTSSQGHSYTPTEVGTYTLTFEFPGQDYTEYSHNPNSAYVNDTYAASSASTTLIVQEDPIEYYSGVPITSEYWKRPIYGENTNWWIIASNYFGEGSAQQARKYIADAVGPLTSHVMWTKELQSGGVVGGDSFEIHGDTYFEGTSRLIRFRNPIILDGKLYYTEPVSYLATSGPTNCVDLHTGEILWSRSDVPTLSFGQIFKVKTIDNIGVLQPLLIAAGGRGSVVPSGGWWVYDAYTGNKLFNVTNIPSGTTAMGANGEHLIYVMKNAGDAENPDWYLAQWNSSKLWDYSGYTLTVGDTVDASTSDRYDWNISIPWRNVIGSETWVTNSDLTVSKGSSNPVTVISAVYNDIILCRNGSLPTSGLALSGISTTPYSYFAINLNPDNGAIGSMLWMETYEPPADNINVFQGGYDPESRVFIEYYKQTAQWVGYNMDTGKKLWTTEPQTDVNSLEYYGNIRSSAAVAQLAYGKLYSSGFGGLCFCYDLETGERLWTYGNGGEGNSTNAGFSTGGQTYYPLFIDAIANGVVYLETTEHTVQTPIYDGAMKRAINATDGTEIWTISGWTSGGGGFPSYAIADGYSTWFNGYDSQIYAVGKGPSTTTVTVSPKVTVQGSSIIVEGTVIDTAAGTTQDEQASRFPEGVPAVSDESMTDWMGYVYQQQPFPEDVKGVKVFLKIQDPNGEYYSTYVTTDRNGKFSHMWTPAVVGEYKVTAMFEGSNAYYTSQSTTTFGIDEAPATEDVPSAEDIAQTTVNQMPAYPTIPEIPAYLTIDLVILIIAAVGVVIGLVAYVALRKQK
jgi:hypothetical protein